MFLAEDTLKPMIAIVEPISSGLDLIVTAAQMGYHTVILTDGSQDRAIPAHYLKDCHAILKVDTGNPEAMEKIIRDHLDLTHLSGVVPGFEYFVPSTNQLAARLGLMHLPLANLIALRDKAEQKTLLRKGKVNVSASFEVTCTELTFMVRNTLFYHFVFPVVIKPTNLSGSIGVRRCDSMADVATYALEMAEGFSDLELTPTKFLIEEYIEGPELSVEGVVNSDGSISCVSITQKILGPEPCFVELGHIVSENNFAEHQTEICDYAKQVVRALGISHGVFHAEMRLHPTRGPILMEIGARLPGDHLCDLIKMATGVDLAATQLMAYTGQTVAIPATPTYQQTAGIQFFAGVAREVVPQINQIGLKSKFPKLMDFQYHLQPGSSVATAGDFSSRMFHVIFTATNLQQWELEAQRLVHVLDSMTVAEPYPYQQAYAQ